MSAWFGTTLPAQVLIAVYTVSSPPDDAKIKYSPHHNICHDAGPVQCLIGDVKKKWVTLKAVFQHHQHQPELRLGSPRFFKGLFDAPAETHVQRDQSIGVGDPVRYGYDGYRDPAAQVPFPQDQAQCQILYGQNTIFSMNPRHSCL